MHWVQQKKTSLAHLYYFCYLYRIHAVFLNLVFGLKIGINDSERALLWSRGFACHLKIITFLHLLTYISRIWFARGQSITVKIVLTRARCQKWPDLEPSSSRGAHVFDFAIRVYQQNNSSFVCTGDTSEKRETKIQKTNRSRYYKPTALQLYMLRIIYLQDTIIYVNILFVWLLVAI